MKLSLFGLLVAFCVLALPSTIASAHSHDSASITHVSDHGAGGTASASPATSFERVEVANHATAALIASTVSDCTSATPASAALDHYAQAGRFSPCDALKARDLYLSSGASHRVNRHRPFTSIRHMTGRASDHRVDKSRLS